MLRRSLVALPALALTAALAGAVLPRWWAAVLAAVLGVALALALGGVAERRVRALSQRVMRFAEGETRLALDPEGSTEWRRLTTALTVVGSSLDERFDALVDERARVERLLDDLPIAVLLFTDGGLAYANPAARTLFDVRDTAPQTPLRVLGVTALAHAVAEAGETGRALEVEVRRDERALVARAAVSAPGEVALLVTDVTDVRRIDAIRSDFVTNASHELKTPVAGILALADSLGLAMQCDPDRAETMVQRLQTEAGRLAQLVRELLDLARLEEDAASQRGRRRVDVTAVLRAQVERLGPLAEDRQVTITIDAPAPAPIVALPEDMRLIVANLLDNAVQYSRGGGRVWASAGRSGGEVVIEVRDEGFGIPDTDRDRIFERFYRVDKGRSRAAGGTGLGLSIVRHAAQRHGGDVTVRSVLGEGSTFRVVLPVDGAVPGA